MVKIVSLSSHRPDGGKGRPACAPVDPHERSTPLWPRPRLLAWLEGLGTARIILLQAPAAFGKTAALQCSAQALAATGRIVVRLSCRRSDEEPRVFLRRLYHVLARAGLNTASDGQQAQELAAEHLTAQIEFLGRPLDLLLDEESARLHDDSLSLLWELALSCSHFRVFVATRRKLTAGLARARTQGHVLVADAQLLTADPTETRALFDSAGLRLGDELLDTVVALTDGWALALKLLMASATDIDSIAAIASGLGKRPEVMDFFAEEVLSGLDGEQRSFLTAIAILDCLCPALADAMTGRQDGRETLDRLCDEGRFVLRTSPNGWYRLHPVFASYLRSLEDTEGSDVRRTRLLRAKQWFEASGMFIEAFDYAVRAGELESAAYLLDAHCDDLYLEGFERAILPTTSRLPAAVRQRYPRLLLAMSWRMMAEWQFDQADALLNSAQARLDELRARRDGKTPEIRDLEYEIKHRRIMQWLFKDDFPRVFREAEILVKDIEHRDNPYLVMSLYSAMMYAQREQFQLGALDRLELLAREQLHSVPSRYMHVFFEAMAAPGKLLRGETDVVISYLEAALKTAISISKRGSPVGATVALMLSEARYVCDDIEAAEALLAEYLPVAAKAGFVDQLISGYLTRARLHRYRKDADGALAVLHEAQTIAAERGFHRLGAMVFAEQIALLCHFGREEEAVRVASWEGLPLSTPPEPPRRGATREENAKALTWVRLAQVRGHIDTALSVSKAWRAYTSAAKATASVIEWDILRAQLLLASNEETSARRVILQALAIACPARRERPFLDESVRLMPIWKGLAVDPSSPNSVDRFIARVAAKAAAASGATLATQKVSAPNDAVAIADLTARELGILKLLATGHLNVEIGRRLGLTAGTVKWYLHRIYGKLGCKRRVMAIEQARRLGLVD
jgi:LuxR family maltose regulon positive regulatory protein